MLQKCLLFISLVFSYGVLAQTSVQSADLERQVKAAYLFKFSSYVEWPDGAFPHLDSPLVIGVIGADIVAEELEHIAAGHTVNGHPVITRKLKRGEPLTGVHILFIGRVEKAHLTEILNEVKSKPLLTVTDSEEAHALGSMINFVVTDDRLRFEVALAPVGSGGLKISARMLTAAYKVRPGAS
ncbi:MAG: YfiR family protein [Burkholderiaceae bacterium]